MIEKGETTLFRIGHTVTINAGKSGLPFSVLTKHGKISK